MRKLLVSVFAIYTTLAGLPALADDHSIVVRGDASISTAPDFATISVGVKSSSVTVADALRDNNERMTRVIAALRALKISDSEIQTSRFSVGAQYMRDSRTGYDTPTITGYLVSNDVKISVTDLQKVAEIIDATIAAGANSLESVNFDVKNRSDFETHVLTDAVKKARRNAETMAAAEGAQLGKMIAMTNVERSYRGADIQSVPIAITGSNYQTPIMPGSVEMSAQVSVTYAIK